MPDPADQRSQTRPFAQVLQELRRGSLHAELSEALAEVVAGVVKHGKQGSLTLKITVKPENDEAITIADRYDTKIPTPPARASIFFADEAGHISRERLNQLQMPLRGVDGGQPDPQDHEGQEATS